VGLLMQATKDIPRPALRYHGGKWILAPWIISHFPAHRVYVEPYGGAASVLLRKPRSYAEVYNDMDGEVCNVFRVLRNPAQARELERLLQLTPFAREEFEESYLDDGDPIEQARRTIVKSFMGFGSDAIRSLYGTGFRANSNRSGTTPAHDWTNYPHQVASFTSRLQGVMIENRPAVEVIAQHDGRETLHYLDPPYVHQTRGRSHVHRYLVEMSDLDHRELAEVLHAVRGMVVLSAYPCGLYDELYADWRCVQRPALADGARPRTECLWLSPAVQECGQRMLPLEAP